MGSLQEKWVWNVCAFSAIVFLLLCIPFPCILIQYFPSVHFSSSLLLFVQLARWLHLDEK